MKRIPSKPSIQVIAKEWWDRQNGNSYFSARIYLNGEHTYTLPFQYGYGDYYLDQADKLLVTNDHLPESTQHLRQWCKDNGVGFISEKIEGCLKREVKSWGGGV